MYVLVSACSFRLGCRYHGKTVVMGYSIYKEKKITELMREYSLPSVCGEILRDLAIPRPSCNVIEDPQTGKLTLKGREDGKDYTAPYFKGVEGILKLVKIFNVKKEYLLDKSPICGQDTEFSPAHCMDVG